MKAFIYHDNINEPHTDIQLEGKSIVTHPTNSQALYRISPLVVSEKENGLVYTKVGAANSDLIRELATVNAKEDHINLKSKFTVSNLFDKDNTQTESNLVLDEEYTSQYKIQVPEDEEEPRKNYDKFNLFQGFLFANDHFGHGRRIENVNEVEDYEIKFDKIQERLDDMLILKLK